MPGKTWNTWNRLPARHVVPGVGKRKAIGAAFVAVGVVLSGCGTADGDDTTTTTPTTSAAEQSDSPWDLPLEQRPALFDPCAEIPVESIEQGLGGPVETVPSRTHHRPRELMSCAWRTDDASLSILGTWKSYQEYTADRTLAMVEPDHELAGRPGIRMLDAPRKDDRACYQVFFTERGTVLMVIDLHDLLKNFRGQRISDPCEALELAATPAAAHIPSGDFR